MGYMEFRRAKLWALIPESLKKCENCGNKIDFDDADVHHINGKRYDNSPENLKMLCSKCHGGGSKGDPMSQKSVRLHNSMYKKIDELSIKLGINQSLFIRNAIEMYLKSLGSDVRGVTSDKN